MTNSVLAKFPMLANRIGEVAEVAGYLWQKGWAERNGGNITVNISDIADDSLRNLPPLVAGIPIGRPLSNIGGQLFYCKGTNKRMRDLSRAPMQHGSIVRIATDGLSYDIIADYPVKPTSEMASHMSIHDYLLGKGSSYKAVLHTHPIDLVAMTHHREFLQKDVLSRLLWSMIPETRAFCPRGVGIVPYALPGSFALADATIRELSDYDVVLWEKHGVCAVGENIMEAFDMVDTLSKSAQIYLTAKGMGFVPEGMTDAQMEEMKVAFHLPK
ncbi:MAG: rhamnulose-1-phosphate aldolase [Bacteroidales bacterium]|jgi:rhamnulose-1-phosphate aldolase|nr:rhamnulose-1-phosphate aldolase [Bacteroidales bacterium]